MNSQPSPIACQLNALTTDQRERRAELFSALSGSAVEFRELTDGYAMRFAPDRETWMRLAEFITLEKLCCPFMAFSLKADEENGPVWLRITGREGTKGFLAAELGFSKLGGG